VTENGKFHPKNVEQSNQSYCNFHRNSKLLCNNSFLQSINC